MGRAGRLSGDNDPFVAVLGNKRGNGTLDHRQVTVITSDDHAQYFIYRGKELVFESDWFGGDNALAEILELLKIPFQEREIDIDSFEDLGERIDYTETLTLVTTEQLFAVYINGNYAYEEPVGSNDSILGLEACLPHLNIPFKHIDGDEENLIGIDFHPAELPDKYL